METNFWIIVFSLFFVSYEVYALFNNNLIEDVVAEKIRLNNLKVPPFEHMEIMDRKFGKFMNRYLIIVNTAYFLFALATLITKYFYIGLALIALATLKDKIFKYKNKTFKVVDKITSILVLCFAIYQAMLGVI